MSSDEEISTIESSTDLQDQLALMSHLFDPNADRTAWKHDKVCSVCYQSFSSFGNGKKHYCKFCFRGVCGKCSMHKGLQPEENKALRICDNCYNRGIEDQVKQNYERELAREKEQIESTEESLRAERKNNSKESLDIKRLREKLDLCKQELARKETELANQASMLKDDMRNMELESDTLYENLEDIKNEIKLKESKVAALKEELQGARKQCEVDKERVKQLKLAIDEQEKENLKVKESLFQLEEKEKNSEENNLGAQRAEKELKLRIQKVKEQIEEAKRDNENYKKKVFPLRQERERKVLDFAELEHKSRSSQEDSKVNDQVRNLQEKSAAQKQEILRLQAKLTKNKEEQELEDEETQQTEPEVRGRCKCIIQ